MRKLRVAVLATIFFIAQGGHTQSDEYVIVHKTTAGEIHYRLNDWLYYNATDHVIVAQRGYINLSRHERDSIYLDASYHLSHLLD